MNISVKGIKVKEVQALEEYATKKARKFTNHHDRISKVDIVLEAKSARRGIEQDFEVTIHVHVPGKTETIKELDGSMYAAIDKGTDRMIEILRRHKGKSYNRRLKRFRAFGDRLFGLIRKRAVSSE